MSLPKLIAGPIIKQATSSGVKIWIASSIDPQNARLEIFQKDKSVNCEISKETIPLSKSLFITVFTAYLPPKSEGLFNYDVSPDGEGGLQALGLLNNQGVSWHLNKLPGFSIKQKHQKFAHASCRKPHGKGEDAFTLLDRELASDSCHAIDMLFLTGDQIYADDVDRFMFDYLSDVNDRLELPIENLAGLLGVPKPSRYKLLHKKANFTSSKAYCHLMTLAEYTCMYLLAFSPELWPKSIEAHLRDYHKGCYALRRIMANVPTYFMHDDHEVTDDWNLDEAWQSEVEKKPLGKQIIANALTSYFIFQAWGNHSDFDEVRPLVEARLEDLASTDLQTELCSRDWSYLTKTSPPALIMDTHSRRYSFGGDMQIRSLKALKQPPLPQDKQVILVSPAPVFGIPTVATWQDILTHIFGSAKFDHERWFEHAFSNLMNHFKDSHVENVLILSGDYHYAVNIQAKIDRQNRPLHIYQMISSSAKNSAPKSKLLNLLSRTKNLLRSSIKGVGTIDFIWSLRFFKSFFRSAVLGVNNVGIVELLTKNNRQYVVAHSLLCNLKDKQGVSQKFTVEFSPKYWPRYSCRRVCILVPLSIIVLWLFICWVWSAIEWLGDFMCCFFN